MKSCGLVNRHYIAEYMFNVRDDGGQQAARATSQSMRWVSISGCSPLRGMGINGELRLRCAHRANLWSRSTPGDAENRWLNKWVNGSEHVNKVCAASCKWLNVAFGCVCVCVLVSADHGSESQKYGDCYQAPLMFSQTRAANH